MSPKHPVHLPSSLCAPSHPSELRRRIPRASALFGLAVGACALATEGVTGGAGSARLGGTTLRRGGCLEPSLSGGFGYRGKVAESRMTATTPTTPTTREKREEFLLPLLDLLVWNSRKLYSISAKSPRCKSSSAKITIAVDDVGVTLNTTISPTARRG